MRTYRDPLRGRVRELRFLLSLVLLVACASGAAAQQQRRYLIELGAAGSYLAPAEATQLGGATGGLARVGLWLPANFSLEVEGSTHSSTADVGGTDVGIKSFTGSALYNFLIGQASTIYLKAGAGGTKYGSDCPTGNEPGVKYPCGNSGAFLFGAGGRIALGQTIMVRTEGLLVRNSSASSRTFTNVGLNLGLSVMLGSKPIDDSDSDGILNNRDRCPDTPVGAQVDERGCPSDDDNDGVPNGVDRCTTTAVGATVDASGCTRDSDGDNIPDGLDRCPETPTGVLVDPTGCPRDSDGDAIADGLDRCSDTPKGATVDALGCPGDEDGDGVLDGLDRCPRSPVGARVATNGCAQGQTPGRQEQTPTPAGPPPAAAAPAPSPTVLPRTPTAPSQTRPSDAQQGAPPAARDTTARRDTTAPGDTTARRRRPTGGIRSGVIPDVGFVPGTARLTPASYVALDSIVVILLANPSLRVEVAAHTDNAASASENMHLTNLQAEAVRNYLVTKGVPFQQVVPRGYGATVPLTTDTTPRGRAANRRVEIRTTQAGP